MLLDGPGILYDHIDNAVLIMRAKIAGHDCKKEVIIKYPQDWQEAFKERWFPKWLLKKYPVKYTKEKVSAKIFYPEIKIPATKSYVEVYVAED